MKQLSQPILAGTVVGLVVLTLLFGARDSIATLLWKNYRLDTIALLLDSNNAELARSIGNYYFNVFESGVHDLDRAKDAYQRALTLNQSIKRGHFQLARIYFIEGNFFNALEEINKELELYPDYGRSYYVRGLIYGYRNFPDDLIKAEGDFKRFIEWNPTNWAGYNDLSWIQIKQEKFTEAKETVQLAFELLPFTKTTNPWLWTMLGVAELNVGNYTKSRDAFLIVREISDNMTPEYFWSAYPGNNSANAENAFNQFKATLSFNLGIVYENLKEWNRSVNEYQQYLTLLPKGPYPKKSEVEKKIRELSI